MSRIDVDYNELEKLSDALEQYHGKKAEDAINNVLHNQAGKLIAEAIVPLIHPSGRSWKGKAPSATTVMPFTIENNENLAVTVHAIGKYGYLYFPDDGSNTVKHAGNQQFMRKGGEAETGHIVDLCVSELIKAFENT